MKSLEFPFWRRCWKIALLVILVLAGSWSGSPCGLAAQGGPAVVAPSSDALARIQSLQFVGRDTLVVVGPDRARFLPLGGGAIRSVDFAESERWQTAAPKLSPDGSVLALALTEGRSLFSNSTVVQKWIELRRLDAPSDPQRIDVDGYPTHLAFSPDGEVLAVGVSGADLTRWTFFPELRETSDPPMGSGVHLLDVAESRVVMSLRDLPEEEDLVAFSFSADGKQLAAAAGSSYAVWEVATGGLLRKGEVGILIETLAISPDGAMVAVGDATGRLHLRPVAGGPPGEILEGIPGGGTERIDAIAFSSDGSLIATAHRSGVIGIWDAGQEELKKTLRPGSATLQLAFAPRGTVLATVGSDRAVRLWDTARAEPVATLSFLPGPSDDWLALGPAGQLEGTNGALKQVASLNQTVVSPTSPPSASSGWLAAELNTLFASQSPPSTGPSSAPRDPARAAAPSPPTGALTDSLAVRAVPQIGHQASIGTLGFSPDGSILATGQTELGGVAGVRLWDTSTGMELASLPGLSNSVNGLEFSPDGRTLAGVSDETVLWNVYTGSSFRLRIADGIDSSTPIVFSRDGAFAIGGGIGTVLRWDAETGERVWESAELPDNGFVHRLSPHGTYALFRGQADDLSTYRVFDVAAGREAAVLRGNGSLITGVAFDADERTLATCDQEGVVKITALPSGASVFSFQLPPASFGGTQPCEGIALDPDATQVAVAGFQSLIVWDLTTGNIARTLVAVDPDSFRTFSGVAFHPGGQLLVAAEDGGAISYWDTRSGVEVRTIRPRGRDFEFVAMGEAQTAVTMIDRSAAVWDLTTGRITRSYPRLKGPGTSRVAASRDGRRLVASYLAFPRSALTILDFDNVPAGQGGVDTLHASRREIPWGMAPGVDTLRHTLGWPVALSPDGSVIAATFEDRNGNGTNGGVLLWNAETGAHVRTLQLPTNSAGALAFSPDGRLIVAIADSATGGNASGRRIVVWEVRSGALVASTSVEDQFTRAIGFTAEDDVLVAYGSGTIKVWNATAGRLVTTVGSMQSDAGSAGPVAFSPDGSLIVAAYDGDATMRIWDVRTGALRSVLRGHLSAPASLAFSGDGARLISTGPDGTTRLWDVSTGSEVLSMVAVGDRDYVALTPENYYAASPNGAQGMAFRVGVRAFPFDQFDLRLNRPDIVLQRLQNPDSTLVQAYRQAFERRVRKIGLTPEMVSADFHLPVVQVKRGDIPLTTRERTLSLRVQAADSLYPLAQVQVYVNNVPLFPSGGIAVAGSDVRWWDESIEIPLSNGRNKIEVAALNARGAESLRETVETVYDGPAEKPDLYIIAIGVSNYRDSRFNLAYPTKDARDLARIFSSQTDRYNAIHVDTLLNEQVTRENILSLREKLMRTRPDDEVIVFIAGHGLLDSDMAYYFATVDVDFTRPADRGITYDALEGLLDGIPARRKLFLIDTCHAGELETDEATPAQVVGSDGVRVRAIPGARGLGIGIRAHAATALAQELFTDLRRGSGSTVIAAAGGAEFAYESGEWQNGVFTFAIREALEQRTTDTNRDGEISVRELRDFVTQRVEGLTSGLQRPVARRENIGMDYPLFEWRRPTAAR